MIWIPPPKKGDRNPRRGDRRLFRRGRVTFTDDFDSGKIQIKKVSSLNSNTTLQASFKVQQKQADGTCADYPNSQNPLLLTTGADGTVTSGWLPEESTSLSSKA